MVTYVVQFALQLSAFQEMTQSCENVCIGDHRGCGCGQGTGLSAHGARFACFGPFGLTPVVHVMFAATEEDDIGVAAFLVA